MYFYFENFFTNLYYFSHKSITGSQYSSTECQWCIPGDRSKYSLEPLTPTLPDFILYHREPASGQEKNGLRPDFDHFRPTWRILLQNAILLRINHNFRSFLVAFLTNKKQYVIYRLKKEKKGVVISYFLFDDAQKWPSLFSKYLESLVIFVTSMHAWMQQQHTLSSDLTTVLRGINFQSHITTRHVSGKAQAQITGVLLVTEPALDRCKGIHVRLSSSLRELRNQPHTIRSLISGKERTEVLK